MSNPTGTNYMNNRFGNNNLTGNNSTGNNFASNNFMGNNSMNNSIANNNFTDNNSTSNNFPSQGNRPVNNLGTQNIQGSSNSVDYRIAFLNDRNIEADAVISDAEVRKAAARATGDRISEKAIDKETTARLEAISAKYFNPEVGARDSVDTGIYDYKDWGTLVQRQDGELACSVNDPLGQFKRGYVPNGSDVRNQPALNNIRRALEDLANYNQRKNRYCRHNRNLAAKNFGIDERNFMLDRIKEINPELFDKMTKGRHLITGNTSQDKYNAQWKVYNGPALLDIFPKKD